MKPNKRPHYLGFQSGEINILVVVAVFLMLATVALGGLSIYYISQYNDAKTTVDQRSAEAATAAKAEQKELDEAAFAKRQKEPYRRYAAPQVLGSLAINFPKTWNLYAIENQDDSIQLDLYLHPEIVRSEDTYSGPYALRVMLEKSLYTDVLADNLSDVEDGNLSAEPVKVAGITGTRYQGLVTDQQSGIKVVLPIRDKTLIIWTESLDYSQDFATILDRLEVSP